MTDNQKPTSKTDVDTSTCADRLRVLAGQPKYTDIRWELLHAAAELDGMREVLRQAIGEDQNHTPQTAKEHILKDLIQGVRGDLAEWRLACENARDAGWSLKQVEWILWTRHPFTWVIGGTLLLVVSLFVWKTAYG
jgi:hypothetical protein